jgi:hypothetical protein
MSEQATDRTCGTCKRYDPACAYCSLWGKNMQPGGRCTEWGEKKAEWKEKMGKPIRTTWRDSEGRITRQGDLRAVTAECSDGRMWDVRGDKPILVKPTARKGAAMEGGK